MHTTGKHPSNSVKFPALHFMILGAEEMAQWLRVLAALAGRIPFQFLIPRWEPLSGDPTPSNLPRQTWCTYIKAGTYKHIIIQQQKPPSFSMLSVHVHVQRPDGQGIPTLLLWQSSLVLLATELHLQSLFSFCSRISFKCFQDY